MVTFACYEIEGKLLVVRERLKSLMRGFFIEQDICRRTLGDIQSGPVDLCILKICS